MSIPPISSCELKNGLTLLCLDQSKKIAGDRWYICVTIHIDIPVDKVWFTNQLVDDKKFQQISRTLGKQVVFEQKKERNFVSADLKDQMVKDFSRRAEELAAQYFSHPDFAAKYILKVYADQQRRY